MATATIQQNGNLPTSALRGIHINNFSADRFAIKVNWLQRNKREPQAIEICRPYYELWLQYTGRLDWCLQGRGDEPRDITGTMAADDYWENATPDVKLQDLASYILKEVVSC